VTDLRCRRRKTFTTTATPNSLVFNPEADISPRRLGGLGWWKADEFGRAADLWQWVARALCPPEYLYDPVNEDAQARRELLAARIKQGDRAW
jgi:hypothetical protein